MTNTGSTGQTVLGHLHRNRSRSSACKADITQSPTDFCRLARLVHNCLEDGHCLLVSSTFEGGFQNEPGATEMAPEGQRRTSRDLQGGE